jgi:hypothetical protein
MRKLLDHHALTIRVRGGTLLGGAVASPASDIASDTSFEIEAAVAFRRRGVETKLVLPGRADPPRGAKCDPALLKARFGVDSQRVKECGLYRHQSDLAF